MLLLRREAGMRRGRSRPGDDRPLEHLGRRPVALGGGATHASFGRRNPRHNRHRCIDNHFPGYLHRCLGYRLRLHERGRRDGDDGAGDLAVGVNDIGDV